MWHALWRFHPVVLVVCNLATCSGLKSGIQVSGLNIPLSYTFAPLLLGKPYRNPKTHASHRWADFTSPALKPTCRRLGAQCARCHRDWLPPRPHPTSTIFLRCPVLVLSSTPLFLFCLAVLRGLNPSGYGLSIPPRAQRKQIQKKQRYTYMPFESKLYETIFTYMQTC